MLRNDAMAPPLSIADLDLILAHTRELCSEMRGQNVFITGGTGFFGCWLVESFLYANRALQLGAQATILTRNPQAFAQKCPHLASDPAITLLAGDVRDFPFPQGDFRYVVHAASEISAGGAADEIEDTIKRGAERTLQFAAAHGTQKFLLTSSGAVYGAQPASIMHMPEEYAGAPVPLASATAYAEGKRAAEQVCADYARSYGIECKIARCYAFVGPHLPLDGRFAIGNFIRDAMRGDVIQVQGDGTPTRSYMYAADLMIWLWTMLFRAPSLEVFNVGSDQAVSILELAQTVAAALDAKAGIHVAHRAVQSAPVQQYVPSTRKAEQQLGLQRRISLEEAIRRTAAWHGYRS
jgi:nucleoside-diphosphate-sugar epimerase